MPIMSSIVSVREKFKMYKLADPVFLIITGQLSVGDILSLEASKILVNGTAGRRRARELIDLAFLDIKVFRFINIKSTLSDYKLLAETLLRCGKKLKQFEFMSSEGDRMTLHIIQRSPTLMRRLAKRCPNLTKFERRVCNAGSKYIIEYIKEIKKLGLVVKLTDLDLSGGEPNAVQDSVSLIRVSPMLENLIIRNGCGLLEAIKKAIKPSNQIKKLYFEAQRREDYFVEQCLNLVNRCSELESVGFGLIVGSLVNQKKIYKEITKCPRFREIDLDISAEALDTAVSVFGTKLIKSLTLRCFRVSSTILDQVTKLRNLQYLTLRTFDILQPFSDLNNFPKLVDIKIKGDDSTVDEHLLIQLLENRGRFVTTLTGPVIVEHRRFVSTLSANCTHLVRVGFSLVETRSKNSQLREQEVALLIGLNVKRYLRVACEGEDNYDKLLSYKKKINSNYDRLCITYEPSYDY